MRMNPFKKKNTGSQEMSLNITAMADIFTILLVFLLKSFATGSMQITPTAGLKLPAANAEQPHIEALKIEIAENAVLLEGKPVVTLSSFEFDRGDMQGNGTSQTLEKALGVERKRQTAIAQVNDAVKIDPRILVIADQRTPYSTIKTVLASSAVTGYTDFKLAVIKQE